MLTKKVDTYEGKIYLGSRRGYNGTSFSKHDIIDAIHANTKLPIISMRIVDCVYFVSTNNYYEDGFEIGFINYPRFPLNITELRLKIKTIAVFLLYTFEQNRISIVFPNDETYLLEKDDPE